jgi:hypothetical protein
LKQKRKRKPLSIKKIDRQNFIGIIDFISDSRKVSHPSPFRTESIMDDGEDLRDEDINEDGNINIPMSEVNENEAVLNNKSKLIIKKEEITFNDAFDGESTPFLKFQHLRKKTLQF